MKVSICFLLLITPMMSEAQKTNGIIFDTTEVVLPEYQSIPGIDWYYGVDEYSRARNDGNLTIRKIWYYSDGLKVAAIVAHPSKTDGVYPVIIFNRGSTIRNDIAFVHAPLFKKFVDHGFIVIAPALRQSEGSEGRDEIGGSDVNDILSIEKVITQIPCADSNNVFMLGESRGGVMTYLGIQRGMKLNAAATIGAITDFGAYLRENPWIKPQDIWPDFVSRRQEIISSRSALQWADQLNVPLLILNGTDDPQVKPHHALNLALRLSELNKPFQLKLIEGGNHILSGNATVDRDLEVLRWFDKYRKR